MPLHYDHALFYTQLQNAYLHRLHSIIFILWIALRGNHEIKLTAWCNRQKGRKEEKQLCRWALPKRIIERQRCPELQHVLLIVGQSVPTSSEFVRSKRAIIEVKASMMVRAHTSIVKVVVGEDLHCICGNAMQCNAMQIQPWSRRAFPVSRVYYSGL
jgi:hypothetical protein